MDIADIKTICYYSAWVILDVAAFLAVPVAIIFFHKKKLREEGQG